jgi:hypothetical protein
LILKRDEKSSFFQKNPRVDIFARIVLYVDFARASIAEEMSRVKNEGLG